MWKFWRRKKDRVDPAAIAQRLERMRREYKKTRLSEKEVDPDPLKQFLRWLDEAIQAQVWEPNAMALATVKPDGTPAVRMVLLKGVDHGLRFYTNLNSPKAQQLRQNPHTAVVFFWPELERQVRIEGVAEELEREIVEAYFQTRPFASRIGAWVSPQSQPIASRFEIEKAFAKLAARYANGNVPVPPHWGGFRIIPTQFEFWQGRQARLHDRIRYRKENGRWIIERLAP